MGRPSKPLIDRTNVITTALQMIDERGTEGFNMRDLGKRLGVNPASLYHHFHDKDEILGAVAEALLRSGRVPRQRSGANGDWESTAIEMMLRYRAVILAHPNATTMILTRRSRYRPALMFQQYE